MISLKKTGSVSRLRAAVVGSGPAGLMAAATLAEQGCETHLFEKRKSAGRKLLVAGSSGLNITFDAPMEEFLSHYGASASLIRPALEFFPPERWRAFIEGLGIGTFKGTSRRWFVEGMKAPELLRGWTKMLEERGVIFHPACELSDFDRRADGGVELKFAGERGLEIFSGDVAILALGGGSWEPQEKPLRWVELFRGKGLGFEAFRASNVGFQVAWPEAFLREVEGKPIKNVVVSSARGQRSGDLIVTRYGLEGTPVYAVGEIGEVFVDLKPDFSDEKTLRILSGGKENLSPIRRVKRFLHLSEAALALIFHGTPPEILSDLSRLAQRIKRFPLELRARQPLDEAISSAGGVRWDELDESLMLRRYPGVWLAGEMIDWDAPTGGFLIQACVSQGRWAGSKAAERAMGR